MGQIWQAFIDLLANGLLMMNNGIDSLGIPYSFGFAIILFTLIIKLITFPLNAQQAKSTRATQALQPKLKALQKKYGKDREGLSKAQMELYKEAGVNPLGGCLPMLVQMPIWFALYRALFQLANETTALDEGFFWIPSLSGPVSGTEGGIGWLTTFVNGAPAIGWGDWVGYLVLPIILVVSQLFMQRMMTPQSTDPQQKTMSQMMMFMPFMFGYFALIVPAGLSLYWFTNNILSMGQQYYTNRTFKNVDEQKKTAKKSDNQNGKSSSSKVIDGEVLEDSADSDADTSEQVQSNGKPSTKSRPKRKRKKQRQNR